MESEPIPYEKQIFVCTNDREGAKASCGDHRGAEVFAELRKIAKERGLHPRIRVAQAKCLGQCSRGVNVMVYPDNVWHQGLEMSDVEALADRYLSGRNEIPAAHPDE